MVKGLFLFLAICLLAVMPLLYRPLGLYAVGTLFGLWLWTALQVRKTSVTKRGFAFAKPVQPVAEEAGKPLGSAEESDR